MVTKDQLGEDDKFESISGLRREKETLKEVIVWPTLNPKLFTGLLESSKNILFFGPSVFFVSLSVKYIQLSVQICCGKTLLARAAAAECDASFISITSSMIKSKWSVGEKRENLVCHRTQTGR